MFPLHHHLNGYLCHGEYYFRIVFCVPYRLLFFGGQILQSVMPFLLDLVIPVNLPRRSRLSCPRSCRRQGRRSRFARSAVGNWPLRKFLSVVASSDLISKWLFFVDCWYSSGIISTSSWHIFGCLENNNRLASFVGGGDT